VKKSFGEDGKAHCPQCRSKASRIFTSVPIIFKGSGFYVTDHKKSNPASTPVNKEPSASTPDKKAESPKPKIDPKMD
jgi:predicted nucleic acid-binding Zn ribbon protein